ncbi:MAG: hypothetical protein K1W05_01555 [Desulfovibrio sp.]|jgi:hypothetical protein
MSNSAQIFLDLVAADLIDNFGQQNVTRNAECIVLTGNIDALADKGILPCVTDTLVKIAIRRYAGYVNWGKETQSEAGYKQFYMDLSSIQQAELENIISGVFESRFGLVVCAADKDDKIEFSVKFTYTDKHGEKTSKEWPSHADTNNLDPEQLASWFNDNIRDPETFCF